MISLLSPFNRFCLGVLLTYLIVSGCQKKGDTGLPSGKSIESLKYTQEEIDYFLEVALGSEYGDQIPRIKKWTQDLNIEVHGSPTEIDRQTLVQVIGEINELIQPIQLSYADTLQPPNVEVYFIPESEFSQIEPNYVPVNYGFFWVWWNDRMEIYKARALISTVKVSQKERSHLIREELTQILGLMSDSPKYFHSIFYQGWTDVTEYDDIDRKVIEMLYLVEVKPNMTMEEVEDILRNLKKN